LHFIKSQEFFGHWDHLSNVVDVFFLPWQTGQALALFWGSRPVPLQ
jgi:hypothetical protein